MKTRYYAVLALFLALLLASGLVYAVTITVDGNGADWPAGTLLVTDANETGIFGRGSFDILDVYFTNDSTNMYWRFDTAEAPMWQDPTGSLAGFGYVDICMDTDNNQATGTNSASCNCGTASPTYDSIVRVNPGFGVNDVLDPSTCAVTSTAATTAGATTVTEVGVALNLLASLPTGCGVSSDCTVPTVLGAWNPADGTYWEIVQGNGQGVFSSSTPARLTGPTAVSLQRVAAAGDTSGTVLWATALVGLAALSATAVWRRRHSR